MIHSTQTQTKSLCKNRAHRRNLDRKLVHYSIKTKELRNQNFKSILLGNILEIMIHHHAKQQLLTANLFIKWDKDHSLAIFCNNRWWRKRPNLRNLLRKESQDSGIMITLMLFEALVR